jgi:hypothetical protein
LTVDVAVLEVPEIPFPVKVMAAVLLMRVPDVAVELTLARNQTCPFPSAALPGTVQVRVEPGADPVLLVPTGAPGPICNMVTPAGTVSVMTPPLGELRKS